MKTKNQKKSEKKQPQAKKTKTIIKKTAVKLVTKKAVVKHLKKDKAVVKKDQKKAAIKPLKGTRTNVKKGNKKTITVKTAPVKKTAVKKSIAKEYPFEKIQKKWSKYWLDKKTYEPNISKTPKPFYNLMMFPYPSAEGLHVGNMYAFTGSDVFGRFMRLNGNDVLEPIGLDGFGIHSENYAIKKGVHPMKQAKVAEKNFYKQLQMIGNGFAWDHRLETYSPEYYRWTQWLFIQMFDAGLVYRKKAPVNWCPSCKTVLANEQVISGKCERCDSEVSKKELEQWFFKITKYAPRLLKNLENLDWSEKVKIAQKNWIGRSEGALIDFEIRGGFKPSHTVNIFTTRPDTIMGVTFLVAAPEAEILSSIKDSVSNWGEVEEYIFQVANKSEAERMADSYEKTGVELKGIKAVNPVNGSEVPVWISDYVVATYGTGVVMGVPAYDARDLEFAQKFGLQVLQTPLIPKDRAIKEVKGKATVQYRLRDWLISRQRYWGPPIPLIHCLHCEEEIKKAKGEARKRYSAGELLNPGWHPVKEKDLPVELPYVKEFRPTGTSESPLAAIKKFYVAKCPVCGREAKRETDVSDVFLDSSWYFLRYPSIHSKKYAFDPEITRKWLPVDMYLGGAEHSVLHLLYSRFITMALKDLGYLDFEEPFTKFRAHGLIIKDGTKMSKSKGNVVNPDEYIQKFGSDALRMCLMFIGPIEEGGDFRDSGIVGVVRFLNRVWNFGNNILDNKKKDLSPWINKTIKEVGEDLSNLKYNTAIAELMVALNNFYEKPIEVTKGDFEAFLIMLSPLAPFITEELWETIGNRPSIHKQAWPKYDERALKSETIELVVQVNGKVRHSFVVKQGLSEKQALESALAEERVKNFIGGSEIKKVFFVPDKIINLVI